MNIHKFLFVLMLCLFTSCFNEHSETKIEYFESGEIKLKFNTDKVSGFKCGVYFRKNGTTRKKLCYKDDNLEGIYQEFHEDGVNVSRSIPYTNGKIEGTVIEFSENGRIKDSIQYINNQKAGDAIFYDSNSKIKAFNKFEINQIVYKALYDFEGKIFEESYFPLVNINNDTIQLGDTLDVLFSLPELSELKKKGNIAAVFGFKDIISSDYEFPSNNLEFVEEEQKHSFQINKIGVQELYGSLLFVEQGDTTYNQMFKRQFVVIE